MPYILDSDSTWLWKKFTHAWTKFTDAPVVLLAEFFWQIVLKSIESLFENYFYLKFYLVLITLK